MLPYHPPDRMGSSWASSYQFCAPNTGPGFLWVGPAQDLTVVLSVLFPAFLRATLGVSRISPVAKGEPPI